MDARQSAINVALRRASETRRRLSIPGDSPLNIYDVCEQLGIEVRFLDCKSLEGMFCRDPRLSIFLPSSRHRPRGRIAFSCGHELGHYVLGHGTRVDEYITRVSASGAHDPEELGANVFSSHLLMRRQTVMSVLGKRNWPIETLEPLQVHTIAGYLGVGYGSLLTHLSFGLGLLSRSKCETLSKVSPKSIRREFWADSDKSDLIIVDDSWEVVPVDLEIGDYLATPIGASCDSSLLEKLVQTTDHTIWLASSSGRCELKVSTAPLRIRIARTGYIGSWRHRFEPEESV